MIGGLVRLLDTISSEVYEAVTTDINESPVGTYINLGLLKTFVKYGPSVKSYNKNVNTHLLLPIGVL